MKYDIFLIDLDDTLFDFPQAEADAFQKTMCAYALPYSAAVFERYKVINNALWRQLELGEISQDYLKETRFSVLFSELGCTVDCAAFNRDYLYALGDGNALLPGAEELCEALSALGGSIYLATNGLSLAQRRRLAGSAIKPFINAIFISDEMGVTKPDAAFFDYIFAETGVSDRSRAIMLGDSLRSDMQGGRNAGIATCWFNPAGAPCTAPQLCDYEITALAQFLPLVTG